MGEAKTVVTPLEFAFVLAGGGTRLAKGVGVSCGARPSVGAGEEPEDTSSGILVPHLMQNLALSRTSAEQFGHFLDIKNPLICCG
jgi:hypothetical protein